MPRFSERSKSTLHTVHPDLIRLFEHAVLQFDCSVLNEGGYRTQDQQFALVKKGVSKTMASKHLEGRAIDVAPWPIAWGDTERFYYFGGYIRGLAEKLAINIRWGGDWDDDGNIRDQSFNDLVHFELR